MRFAVLVLFANAAAADPRRQCDREDHQLGRAQGREAAAQLYWRESK
jgi:hypothetical protein